MQPLTLYLHRPMCVRLGPEERIALLAQIDDNQEYWRTGTIQQIIDIQSPPYAGNLER